ncbi:hypothetical protein QJQ45_029232, partial [Haematococcus lacustris]
PVPEDPDNHILDRDEAQQPDLTEAQRKRKASGEARAARDRDNKYHDRKCKLVHLTHHLPHELWDAFLQAALARVKACSERVAIGSLLLGFLVRGLFTLHVADPCTASPCTRQPSCTCTCSCAAACLATARTLGPSAAVAAVLAAHPDLCARLEAVPRYHSDTNMVNHVGKQLETASSNMLTLLLSGRLKKSVSLAGAKCQARHIFIDTRGLYDLMCDADMLGVLTKEGGTSLDKFRNGALPDPAEPGKYIEGPKDSQVSVANRWDALLPDPRRQKLASLKHRFDQIVRTDGVALSVMFMRPKPADPPAELPRMGAVKPLAHLDAEWLGAQATKTCLAQVKPQLKALSQVRSRPSSLASYRRFADTVLATYDAMWAEVSKPRWATAKFRLYCGSKASI